MDMIRCFCFSTYMTEDAEVAFRRGVHYTFILNGGKLLGYNELGIPHHLNIGEVLDNFALDDAEKYGIDKFIKSQNKYSFMEFLKDSKAFGRYLVNSKLENQRWNEISSYIDPEQIKNKPKEQWVMCAFNWNKTNEGNEFWSKVSRKWKMICKLMPNIEWDWDLE